MSFPSIRTIDDVLPHIQGNDNFSVNKKDDYIVIDYILSTPETFLNPVEKECRGIIFYADGQIMARRLHKFFNVNEREETKVENIDFSRPHHILEKLDGSMITPMTVHGNITWGSKAGETFLTPQIKEFVLNNPYYYFLAVNCIENNFTPIFEWCSNKNRIVINHPEDRLVLIAIRDNVSGEYMEYPYLKDTADVYNIEVVKEYPGTVQSMEHLIEITKPIEDAEGFVVRFEDGQMVKIKGDQYCLLHKSKNTLSHEKNVVAILINNEADDFRVLLSPEDRKKFENFEHCFFLEVGVTVFHCQNDHAMYNASTMTRKEFAELSKDWKHGAYRSIVFKFFDRTDDVDKEIYEEVVNIIKKNCGSQTNINKVRHLWGRCEWHY